MTRRHSGRLNAALAAVVFVIALWIFGDAAGRIDFWADENDYLITSRYFRILFVERDLASAEWGDNYWTHTQPMLTRYLIGGWLWARGYDLDAMPRRYDLTTSYAENERKGRVPDPVMLADARLPMVTLAAGSVVVLYLVGAALGGVVAGLAAAALALASPLAREHLVRAMPEAPLGFFLLLALLLGVVGMRRGTGGGLSSGWAIGLGVALGLALATKLTAVLGLAAVAAFGLLVAFAAAVIFRPSGTQSIPVAGSRGADADAVLAPGRARRGTVDLGAGARAARGWALAVVVALGVFAVSNPHLYPDPLLHTAHLFQERIREERGRQREVPRLAVRDPLARPGPVLEGSFVSGTLTGSRGVPVEAGLALVGAAALAMRAWRGWRLTGKIPPAGLALLTVLAYVVGVSAGLHLLYARYFVPTLLLGTLLSGVGVGAIADATVRLLRWKPGAPRLKALPFRRGYR